MLVLFPPLLGFLKKWLVKMYFTSKDTKWLGCCEVHSTIWSVTDSQPCCWLKENVALSRVWSVFPVKGAWHVFGIDVSHYGQLQEASGKQHVGKLFVKLYQFGGTGVWWCVGEYWRGKWPDPFTCCVRESITRLINYLSTITCLFELSEVLIIEFPTVRLNEGCISGLIPFSFRG